MERIRALARKRAGKPKEAADNDEDHLPELPINPTLDELAPKEVDFVFDNVEAGQGLQDHLELNYARARERELHPLRHVPRGSKGEGGWGGMTGKRCKRGA